MATTAVDVQKQIKLILANVIPEDHLYLNRGPLKHRALTQSRNDPPPVTTDPDSVEMVHEQVNLLKVVYGQCPSELKSAFAGLLLGELGKSTAGVIITALVHIGHTASLISFLADEEPGKRLMLRTKLWEMLRGVLAIEPHRFTDDELRRIEVVATQDERWADAMGRRVSGLPPRQGS